ALRERIFALGHAVADAGGPSAFPGENPQFCGFIAAAPRETGESVRNFRKMDRRNGTRRAPRTS
ncbi:hypothetical protein ABZ805_25255, partial [Saccharopolyspora sp. NPDC047091]|uniref:hypothetical protein n=1 Tax=Saccharopolyspora sp. NPDC047091 TaxID=3155924 RepID=UPI0033FA05FB